MNKLIFLSKKQKVFNWHFLKLNLKYSNTLKNLYFSGKYGFLKILLHSKKKIDFFSFKEKYFNFWLNLSTGFVGYLYLNGLGFKCTKKFFNINKKLWRFNVGHSQVFMYFTPENVIMKVKQRFLCFFGIKKQQINDIANKIKNFHMPDSYKGVGIKFPNEVIILKKGKVRQ